ncbi:MAG: serine/threonine-protein kinase [Myxococcota bacterium]
MRVGESIAGYDIVARLKSGGMAALYLGKRERAAGFAKHVAIKVVHEHLADDEGFIKMFLDEARITARIEHPNVVHVHDLGEAHGNYFLVMEYVPSVALSQLLRAVGKLGRRLSPEVASWIAMQIAAGLHAAHETPDDEGRPLGIVHRDVSPKNILLAYKGYVKVIDFGIAKAAGRATQTQGGLLKGTFRYMSPEQATGRMLDARSDVYALGIVLWEMLVLRRLFDAENDLALLDMVRDPTIVPPGQLVRTPPAVDAVVMKALAKNAEDRFSSCDEFRAALAAAIPSALGINARQVGQLIGATFADQAAADADPSVASAIGKPLTVQVPEDVLARMTLDPEAPIAGMAALKSMPVLVTPTGAGSVPTSGVVVREPPTTVTPTPAPLLDQAAPPSMEFSAPPASKPRRWLWAVVAVPILLGGGATAVWLSQSPNEPVAVPLAPRPVEVEPPAQAAPPQAVEEPRVAVGTPVPSEAPSAAVPSEAVPSETDPPAVAMVEAERTVDSAMSDRSTMSERPTMSDVTNHRTTSTRMRTPRDTPTMMTTMRRRRTTMSDDAILIEDW